MRDLEKLADIGECYLKAEIEGLVSFVVRESTFLKRYQTLSNSKTWYASEEEHQEILENLHSGLSAYRNRRSQMLECGLDVSDFDRIVADATEKMGVVPLIKEGAQDILDRRTKPGKVYFPQPDTAFNNAYQEEK